MVGLLSKSQFIILITLGIFLSACGVQNSSRGGDDKGQQHSSPIGSNVDLEGTTLEAPVSTHFKMSAHSFGGSNLRTISSSHTYKLVGGVGVE
jgi:hypothetical protein